MASKPTPSLSLNEWVVLALLGEQPAHGFALARELEPDSDLGRILTVRRPLVYRALDRIVAAELAVPHQVEPGVAGPQRTQHKVTRRGGAALRRWLVAPVEHVRDLRIEFLVKLRLTERSGRDVGPLVTAQQQALRHALDALSGEPTGGDVVDLWRRHNSAAASAFLVDVAGTSASSHQPG